MAIALPFIVQIVSPLQSAVEWLAGGTAHGDVSAAGPAVNDAGNAPASGQNHRGPGDRAATGPRDSVNHSTAGASHSTTPASRPEGSRRRPAKSWGGPIRTAYAEACARPEVRVVREAQGTRSRADAGRMVIAGRLADVCAELDRLVALETAH